MPEELTGSGPKDLRDAYDRVKAERDELRQFKRSTLLEKAGVPPKAHGFVMKALGDDATYDDPDTVKTMLAEQGIHFGDTPAGESGGPPPPTPEDTERIAAQQRTQALMAAGIPPSSAPPTPDDNFAEAVAKGDVKQMVAAQNAKLLDQLG